MYWGYKCRFHDIDNVACFNPKSVEFHLTDEDVLTGHLNGKIYNMQYTVHLPEYWKGILINPVCKDRDIMLRENINIYRQCLNKAMDIQKNFSDKSGRLYAIMHPGGASIEPMEISPDTKRLKRIMYGDLYSFVTYIEMIPEYSNVEILIENMPPLPWFYGGQYYSNIFTDADEIAEFCVKSGRKICLDISHLALYCNYSNTNLIEKINLLLPYTKQIHLADASGTDGEGMPIGEGTVNFKEVIEAIKDSDVAVIPEVMWGHKDNYKAFNDVIERCKTWLI